MARPGIVFIKFLPELAPALFCRIQELLSTILGNKGKLLGRVIRENTVLTGLKNLNDP